MPSKKKISLTWIIIVTNSLYYICELILPHVFLQLISQNKYDMTIEIDDMSYSLIWHEQLHLMLIYIFGKLFKIW